MKRLVICFATVFLTGCAESSYVPQVSMAPTDYVKTEMDTGNTDDQISDANTTEVQMIIIPSENSVEKDGLEKRIEPGRKHSDKAKKIEEKTRANVGSGVTDVLNTEWTAGEIKKMIDVYSVPEKPYIDGRDIREEDKKELLDNRNIDHITGMVVYGLVKENTAMRAFPSDRVITGDLKVPTADFLQETGVYGGSPVAVLHTSADEKWCFVQCENYAGWIKKNTIVIAGKELIGAYLDTAEYAVIAQPYVRCGDDILRLGQVLPRTGDKMLIPENIDKADAALVFNNGELVLTDRPDNGAEKLYVRFIAEPENTLERYLDGTADDFIMLAERLEGTLYSWGDKELTGFDCSSTVGAIYRCCDILLPRNTSLLAYTGAEVQSMDGLSGDERMKMAEAAPAGSLMVIPGHVVMLLDHPERQYFHNSTHYIDEAGEDIITRKAGFTSVNIKSGSGSLYTDIATYIINLS